MEFEDLFFYRTTQFCSNFEEKIPSQTDMAEAEEQEVEGLERLRTKLTQVGEEGAAPEDLIPATEVGFGKLTAEFTRQHELELQVADLTAKLSIARKAALAPSPSSVAARVRSRTGTTTPTLPNPFAKQFHTLIIFGAEGNLSMKKTFPALFTLMRQRHLPPDVAIIGFARESLTDSKFQNLVFRAIYNVTHPNHERKAFLSRITYRQGQFDHLSSFESLDRHVGEREKEQEDDWVAVNGGASMNGGSLAYSFSHTRTFYLAVPPFLYPSIAQCCRRSGLKRAHSVPYDPVGFEWEGNAKVESEGGSLSFAGIDPFGSHSTTADRFILEKPFGKDTESCAELCASINRVLGEDQVYRIDHYLGKELVMNVLVMRFANISFNAIWNRVHIQSVQVLCKEVIGTAGRGGYFDEYGIIRDVMQNHLLQILALVGMEQPLSLAAEHIRMEKIKLLQAVQPLQLKDLLVGQYVAADGNPGYLEDPSITNKSSVTETFAAAVLYINNPRWDGVPFILKAGKALDESKVEVRIKFHAVPGVIAGLADCAPNELVIRVQPDERIFWKITSKVPGLDFTVETRRMDLLYASRGGSGTGSVGTQHPGVSRENSDSSPLIELPGAYERLILEVLRGDQTNFVHADELIASWRIFTPALHELAKVA